MEFSWRRVPIIGSFIKREQFLREHRTLKRYFATPEGVETLVQAFIKAQTNQYDEPIGALKDGVFTFSPEDEQKKEWYAALVLDDSDALRSLEDEVEDDVREGSARAKEFARRWVLYGEDKLPLHELIEGYVSYATSWCRRPEADGIHVHVHPTRKIATHEDETHEYFLIGKSGFSGADRRYSRENSLGLIEFENEIEGSRLDILCSLSHRIGWWEGSVGKVRMRVDAGGMLVQGPYSRTAPRKRDVPRVSLDRRSAVSLLVQSAYVLPFLDFDASLPLEQAYRPDLDTVPESLHGCIESLMESWRRGERACRNYLDCIWPEGFVDRYFPGTPSLKE